MVYERLPDVVAHASEGQGPPPWSGLQSMFLERVNFTLMGMVTDWVILMIILDQVVVQARSLLHG